MKQTAETSPIVASAGMTSSVMGIDPKHAARITKYLRDNIYSDKILATIREVSMNGIDEHIKFKVNRPVEVGVKNEDGYSFFVRDHARGLAEKDIREVFGMYGSSSKRNSNEQAGTFGCGSLSPFSYSDSFFVTSYFEGTKTVYSCVLGGDSQNISVGHIYKLDESPTSESGLEVIVPVKPNDVSNFWDKIRNFVRVSPYNISADILGTKILPIKPSLETKLGNYNMRVLENDLVNSHNDRLYFQMGGNTYKTERFTGTNGGKIKDGHIIVIDIPIGDCSVTLSRESFEETAKNKEVFAEIETLLQNYVAQDMVQFKDKKVLDLIGDALSGLKKYESEAFAYFASDIYSDCWDFVKSVRLLGTGTQMMQNGKPVCIVIPSDGIPSYWKDKVTNHLQTENLSAYVAGRGKYTSAEVDKAFHIICARKVKYAKLTRDSKRFVVKTGGRNFGTFNALEFFNAVSSHLSWGLVATNEKEASDFMAVKKANVKSRNDLENLRISKMSGNYQQWSAQSEKMFDAIVALGFVRDGGPEDHAIRDRLDKERREKDRKQNLVRNASKSWIAISPRLQTAYLKEKNAERVTKFWSAVMNEQSLRGKILSAYQDSYAKSKLERHELRRILKLA
jgi:hypothetical protein